MSTIKIQWHGDGSSCISLPSSISSPRSWSASQRMPQDMLSISFRWRVSSFRMRASFKEGIKRDRERIQSYHDQQRQMPSQLHAQIMSNVLFFSFFIFFAIFMIWSLSFMSSSPSLSLPSNSSIFQQACSCHRLTCSFSLSVVDNGNSRTGSLGSEQSGLNEHASGPSHKVRHSYSQE